MEISTKIDKWKKRNIHKHLYFLLSRKSISLISEFKFSALDARETFFWKEFSLGFSRSLGFFFIFFLWNKRMHERRRERMDQENLRPKRWSLLGRQTLIHLQLTKAAGAASASSLHLLILLSHVCYIFNRSLYRTVSHFRICESHSHEWHLLVIVRI